MEKLTKRAVVRGREHRLEVSLAVQASPMERRERYEIFSKSKLFSPLPNVKTSFLQF